MFSLQSTIIDTYRIMMQPARMVHRRMMLRAGTMPVTVVFYHRVADESPTPWTISPAQFQRQISWLREHFEIVSLAEAQERIRSGTNHQETVSITFDDGYAENLMFAIPYLIEQKIPFTYFVTLDNAATGRPFQHDLDLGYSFPVNTIEEVRAIASTGAEIGAHTRTHPDLGHDHSEAFLVDEIVTATRELSNLIDREIAYFAFPYGLLPNLNRKAFQIALQNGFKGVCSAFGGYNVPGGDPFHIKRIHGDPNFSRFRNWMSWDHRLFDVPEFSYTTPVPE